MTLRKNIGWPQLSEACRGLNACMYICLLCVRAFVYARSTRALWRACRPYARLCEQSGMPPDAHMYARPHRRSGVDSGRTQVPPLLHRWSA